MYSQDDTANLRILMDKESFTVAVIATAPVSVSGLQFAYTDSHSQIQTYSFEAAFPVLQLTGSKVNAGACYVIQLNGSSSVLPGVCSDSSQVFKLNVAPADVFWYDSVFNRPRDMAIYQNNEATSQLCSGSMADCSIIYLAAPIQFTETPLPAAAENSLTIVTKNSDWKPVTQSFDAVDMVLVPAGCFELGNDPDAYYWKDSGYVQGVPSGGKQCFSEPFWIDQTEVTNAQFEQFKGSAAKPSSWIDSNRPRETITWLEAQDYCMLRGGRLPTEAEWEYAARGPDALPYPWGDNFNADNVVYARNSNNQTADVGSRPNGVSWVGALDMSGNVMEWVGSQYKDYPYNAADGREAYSDSGSVLWGIRGRAFNDGFNNLRVTSRTRNFSTNSLNYVGFRCAHDYSD